MNLKDLWDVPTWYNNHTLMLYITASSDKVKGQRPFSIPFSNTDPVGVNIALL